MKTKKNVVINTMALVGLFLTYKIFNKTGSPLWKASYVSLCTYVHFVLAQKHISRNTWIMQANSIMWTDGYLLPGSALSDRKKLQSSSLLYIYIFFVSFIMFIWIPILFIFNVFFLFSFFFLRLFADNVGVWAFLTLHWMWFFLSIYNLQYRGSSQFFQCSCLLIEVLTVCVCVCVCTRTCVEVLCACDLRVWMSMCALLSALARLPYCVVVEFKINR